jgi:hypothetical protein
MGNGTGFLSYFLVGFGMGKGGRFWGCLFCLRPRDGMEQATTNTGVLHCVQDDDIKQATTRSNGVEQATTNTGILHFVQDDDFEG